MKELTDLKLVSALDAAGVSYDDVQVDRNRLVFLYKNEDEVIPLIKQYYSNNLNLDARKLMDSYQDMKTLVSQMKG